MADESEASFTRKICSELVGMNAMVLPIVAGKMSPPGWPDRYVHHAWWKGWLEFKSRTGECSAKQKFIIENLNARQVDSAFVVRPIETPEGCVGQVENGDGERLFLFDGTGKDLLHQLVQYSGMK